MNLKSTLKLVFSETAFLNAELDNIEAKRKAGAAYQPAEEFRDEALARIRAKRRNLLRSAIWIVSLVLGGAAVAFCINITYPMSWFWVKFARALSVMLVAWAVWSKIGDVETFKGETLLELTNQYIYKLSYSAGIFVGSLALFLEGPGGT